MNRNTVFLCALLVMPASPVRADTVAAKLHFANMLPFTGIVYAPDVSAESQRGTLDQKDKQFVAPIAVVGPGSELRIKNSDEFDHNIYADDKQTGIAFDLGMIKPKGNFRLPVRWAPDSLLHLGCKIHPKMKAYVANIHSQHYATVSFMPGKQDYLVELKGVPAKLKEIRILLPDMAPLTATVTAGQTRQVPVVVRERTIGSIELSRRGD